MLGPPPPVVVGADDDEPQAAAMAKGANPRMGMSVLDRQEPMPLLLLEPFLAVIIGAFPGDTPLDPHQ
jgi:hypothetical protein